jgi:RNA polymerase sigma-70 factor, ECF subfamily
MTPGVPPLDGSTIERVFREEYGRAVAVLTRVFGDIDIAEEAVQEAFTNAVQRWPSTGLPPSPAGWIITTARNRAIDRLRREASREDRHASRRRCSTAVASQMLSVRRGRCTTTGCA